MAFSAKLLHRLRQLVADAHSAFVVNYISPNAVPNETLERLRRLGMVRPRRRAVEQAYLLGRLIAAAQNHAPDLAHPGPRGAAPELRVGGKPGPGAATPVLKDREGRQLSLAGLERAMERDPVPLTPVERSALDVDAARTAQYIVGLGNRVEQATGNLLIEVDKKLDAAFKQAVRDAVRQNILRRETVARLKSELGHLSGDWARDLDRIAVTEKHNALQEGYASTLLVDGGTGARCYKVVAPQACDTCKRVYLLPGGNPRVFTIEELQRNGSNFGKRAKECLATIGPCHPSCLCTLNRLPEGATPLASGRFAYDAAETHKSQRPKILLRR